MLVSSATVATRCLFYRSQVKWALTFTVPQINNLLGNGRAWKRHNLEYPAKGGIARPVTKLCVKVYLCLCSELVLWDLNAIIRATVGFLSSINVKNYTIYHWLWMGILWGGRWWSKAFYSARKEEHSTKTVEGKHSTSYTVSLQVLLPQFAVYISSM